MVKNFLFFFLKIKFRFKKKKEKYAFGQDQLRPCSKLPQHNTFGSLATQLVDTIDTMVIMDLKNTPSYEKARNFIKNDLDFNKVFNFFFQN
jgi:hypothetical protein